VPPYKINHLGDQAPGICLFLPYPPAATLWGSQYFCFM